MKWDRLDTPNWRLCEALTSNRIESLIITYRNRPAIVKVEHGNIIKEVPNYVTGSFLPRTVFTTTADISVTLTQAAAVAAVTELQAATAPEVWAFGWTYVDQLLVWCLMLFTDLILFECIEKCVKILVFEAIILIRYCMWFGVFLMVFAL